ncbi:MAG: hypothetical protein AAF675_00690 [Pseudomonadota bacterium]
MRYSFLAVVAAAVAAVVTAPLPGLQAGQVDVLAAEARRNGATWTFTVTVEHADTGWDHYADAWRVVGPDGTVFGTRVLAHPHVNEQPFTRSLSGVSIPTSVERVRIEGHDSVHGWGGATVTVDLVN